MYKIDITYCWKCGAMLTSNNRCAYCAYQN